MIRKKRSSEVDVKGSDTKQLREIKELSISRGQYSYTRRKRRRKRRIDKKKEEHKKRTRDGRLFYEKKGTREKGTTIRRRIT